MLRCHHRAAASNPSPGANKALFGFVSQNSELRYSSKLQTRRQPRGQVVAVAQALQTFQLGVGARELALEVALEVDDLFERGSVREAESVKPCDPRRLLRLRDGGKAQEQRVLFSIDSRQHLGLPKGGTRRRISGEGQAVVCLGARLAAGMSGGKVGKTKIEIELLQ